MSGGRIAKEEIVAQPPLRVAVDARSTIKPRSRSVGKSLHELIARTTPTGAVEWHMIGEGRQPTSPARSALWEQVALPLAARRIHADVLHVPDGGAPWWQPVPTVVTIYDSTSWDRRESTANPDAYQDRVLPAAYHRAAALLTVSQTMRRQLLARWPMLQPKLHVVSPGVGENFLEAEPDRHPIVIDRQVVDEPYVLYVGGAEPRKRLLWALQAWWASCGSRATLVICGINPHEEADVLRMVPRELRDRVIFAPFIGETDMPRLYMRAIAVLYPSLAEGAGLPVIEAQAVGTRVLFSAVGNLSDLQGPGAVVLPVDDLPAWVRTLGLIMQSRSASHGPGRIARAWASQYSWESYVQRTLAVYDSVRKLPSIRTVGQPTSS